MGIRAIRLAVTGPDKPVADINFSPHSNLILGPSDTGKSYVLGCLKYAFGSDKIPKQIKYASGYDRLSFQFASPDGQFYTIFRALSGGDSLFFKGCHDVPLSEREALNMHDVNDFVLSLLGLKNKQIVTAEGKKGNITAGDLRHFSLFAEADTLSEIGYLGAEVVHKTRYKSAFFLMMTGVDDTAIVLGTNKDDRLREKGKVMGLDDAISSLQSELPEGFDKTAVRSLLEKVDKQINANQNLLLEHSTELTKIRSKMSGIGRKLFNLDGQKTSVLETMERFQLLDKKYHSDLERLEMIRTAASVFDAFKLQPCVLCNTPVLKQTKNKEEQLASAEQMTASANAEYGKIKALRFGLSAAMIDIKAEMLSIEAETRALKAEQAQLAARHAEIINQQRSPISHELAALTQMHSQYISQLNTFEKIQQFIAKRKTIEPNTKRTKTVIKRNATDEQSKIVGRVQAILNDWGLEEARQVSFDEAACDIRLMESPRTSYGKGKRALFLSAFSIAVLEHALDIKSPHLGIVAIDSPVLTYRDPKNRDLVVADVVSEKVADKFYNWMADWCGPGQLIIMENEEPNKNALSRIPHTLFSGLHSDGRRGFYP